MDTPLSLGRLGRAEVRRVFAAGRSGANRLGVLYAVPADQARVRFAVAVGRRFGRAVVRNRVRRCWKEAFRLVGHMLRPGWDLVLVARLESSGADLETLKAALVDLSSQVGVLGEESGRSGSAPQGGWIRNEGKS